MKPEATKAVVRGVVATVLLGTAILIGSRNLAHSTPPW